MSCAEFIMLHIKTGKLQSEFFPQLRYSCIPSSGFFVFLASGEIRKLSLRDDTEKLSSLSREIDGI